MSTLWVREYANTGASDAGQSPVSRAAQVAMEPGTDQTPVTFSTSAQSAAFGATTTLIAVIADAAFHYVVAANPTATVNALKVPADTLVFIGVAAGHKIAAIEAA